jgi:hypothetical protein
MAQTVFVVDETTPRQIAELNAKVDRLLDMIARNQKLSGEENPWLPARAFCEKYGISRSTLGRRMKENPCPFEVLDPNEKVKKYRWLFQSRNGAI